MPFSRRNAAVLVSAIGDGKDEITLSAFTKALEKHFQQSTAGSASSEIEAERDSPKAVQVINQLRFSALRACGSISEALRVAKKVKSFISWSHIVSTYALC